MRDRKALPWEDMTYGQAFDLFFLFLSGFSACFWPFLRWRFGARAFDLNGLLAIGIMLVYAAYAPCLEMVPFFWLWLMLVVLHRLVTLIGVWRGQQEHSRYDGVPWLAQAIIRPRPSEGMAKQVCEPVLCWLAAALISQWHPALAAFVALGGVALFARKMIAQSMEDAQIRAMRDKEIEMRQRFARYRGRG